MEIREQEKGEVNILQAYPAMVAVIVEIGGGHERQGRVSK